MKQFSLDNFLAGKDVKGSKKRDKSKLKKEKEEPAKVESEISNKDEKENTPEEDPKKETKKDTKKETKKDTKKVSKKTKKDALIKPSTKRVIDDEEEKMFDSDSLPKMEKTKKAKETTKTSKNDENSKLLPFMSLIEVLSKVENTKGENSKDTIKTLFSNLFIQLIQTYPEDLPRAFYFLLSKVGPTYRTNEFGIGNGVLEKVVSKVIGISEKQIKEKMVAVGDLALVAAEGKKSVQTMDKFAGFITNNAPLKPLTLKDVLDCYNQIVGKKGKSAMEEKSRLLCKIMFKANKEELKFLVRSLQKSLKIGASFKTILSSLARCVSKLYKGIKTYDEKVVYSKLLMSMCQLTDEDIVFKHIIDLINKKEDFLQLPKLCKITPGIPVSPQLARPTNGIEVIFKRFENIPFTCEYKYDGFRGQIHYHDKKTEVFSRNLENMTETYPDIVQYVKNFIAESQQKNLEKGTPETTSFIIDCEMVAYDKVKDKILPFQQLTTRSRKNVDVSQITIHVCMFCFDILYLNGEDLTKFTLRERRERLHSTFTENEYIHFATNLTSDNQEEIETFMNESIASGCEGLIVKAIDKNSEYMPGQRNFSWLKLKKDYLETSIGDSIDLVVIGAHYGKGKRCGLYGSFLLACYNDDTETFESVTMTGGGLKDDELQKIYDDLQEHIIPQPMDNYRIGEAKPDVFFKPSMVWEIKTADLTQSPIYVAGRDLMDDKRGISMRFPRFIRLRPDKHPEEACTSEYIVSLYKQQASIANNFGSSNYDDIDDLY